ncbi:MAG: NAD-binding protein [Promethearchaeota archaeon]
MSKFRSLLIDLKLKIKHNKWPFIICFLFWVLGFIYYSSIESDKNLWNLLAVSLGFRNPTITSDVSGMYQLIWPILLEVIVIGFIFGALIEKFNPVVTSKILAKNQRNHSVIIGYHHFGKRIVDYLKDHHKPYSVIEENEDFIEDLIIEGEPAVNGDPTDIATLQFAAVDKAKEVFIVSNDIRETIVICEKVRELNSKCSLYARLFGEHYYEYLSNEPFNAFLFSTSKWALESIHEWTQGETGKVLVLGRDNLTQRIAEYLGREQNRETFIIDPEIQDNLYDDDEKITIFADQATNINSLESHVNLKEISQIFICWKNEDEYSDSLDLTLGLHNEYPNIKVYTRIFDEELAQIMKKFGATVFSTSEYAFQMLQKHVKKGSAIQE